MIPELGKYAVTVLASWGVTIALLAGLIAVTLWQGARAKRALAAQENRMRQRNG